MDIERIARLITENIDEINEEPSFDIAPAEFAARVNSMVGAAKSEQQMAVLEKLCQLAETDKPRLMQILSSRSDTSTADNATPFYQGNTKGLIQLAKLADLVYNSDQAIDEVLDTIDILADKRGGDDEDLSEDDGYNEDY